MCKRDGFGCIMAILVIFGTFIYIGVEITLFLSDQYVFAYAVKEQGLPYLTRRQRKAYDNLSEADKGKLALAQKKAALIEAASNAVRFTFGSLTTPIIGYVSDKYGRKKALILLMTGELFHIGITAIIVLTETNPWFILIGGICEGLTGGGLLSFFAQVAACLVDLAKRKFAVNSNEKDKQDESDKTAYQYKLWLWFTIFDGLASLCVAFANPMTGALIYRFSFTLPMIISCSLAAVSTFFLCCLPETLESAVKKYEIDFDVLVGSQLSLSTFTNEYNAKGINDDDNNCCQVIRRRLVEFLRQFRKSELVKIEPLLVVTMVIVFFASIVALSDMHYLATYLMGEPFKWNSERIGIYAGATHFISSLLSVIFTLVMIKVQQYRITHRKGRIAMVALQEQIENPEADEEMVLANEDNKTSNAQAKILISVLLFTFIMATVNKITSGMAYNFTTYTANLIIYLAGIPRIFNSFSIPIIRTLFSIWTHPSKQGFIQSVGALVCRIGLLISLTTLPLIYSATAKTLPGMVFYVGAGIMLIVLACIAMLPFLMRRRDRLQRETQTS